MLLHVCSIAQTSFTSGQQRKKPLEAKASAQEVDATPSMAPKQPAVVLTSKALGISPEASMRELFVGNRQLLSHGMFSFNLAEHISSTGVPFLEQIRKLQAWTMVWNADADQEIWTSSALPIGYGS